MKPPRKTEMLRLQAQYKTDAKIAEALGVAEYLVSYWRRKKKLPRHSAPKFSREQIAELWFRFGDDFRGGRELNISKAAFYGWRRKYGLLDRPAILKLEQLELRLPGSDPPAPLIPAIARTAVHKILDRAQDETGTGYIQPDWRLMRVDQAEDSHLALTPGPTFDLPHSRPLAESLPLGEIEKPHWMSSEMGQIEWQLIESRAVLPGQVLSGPAGLASGIGGIGSLYLAESDRNRFPRTVRVEVTRRLGPHAEVDDIVFSLIAHGVHRDWHGAIVEFLGAPVERLSVDRKVRLCALAVHAGARAALCAFDDVTRRHFGRLLRGHYPQCHPDRTALYDGEHFLEGRTLQSLVAFLDTTGRIDSVGPPDDSPAGFLVGPYALPFEVEQVAAALKGRRLAKGRSMLVCPATTGVFRHAQRKGWQDWIIDAGGSVLDVSLATRLGLPGLLTLAAGSNPAVQVTGPFSAQLQNSSIRVILASVRTILSRIELATQMAD